MTKTETDISVVRMTASSNDNHATDALLGPASSSFMTFADPAKSPETLSMTIISADVPFINAVSFSVTGASEVSYTFSDENGVTVGKPTSVDLLPSTSTTPVNDKLPTPVEAYTVTISLTGASPYESVKVSDFVVSACYTPGTIGQIVILYTIFFAYLNYAVLPCCMHS